MSVPLPISPSSLLVPPSPNNGGPRSPEKIFNETPINLLEGEDVILREDNVFIFDTCNRTYVPGSLFLTNYQLLFIPKRVSSYDDVAQNTQTSIPLGSLCRVEKTKQSKLENKENGYQLAIQTKNLQLVKFSFFAVTEKKNSRKKFYYKLLEDKKPTELFAFSYKMPIQKHEINGWAVYNVLKEYSRQGALGNVGKNRGRGKGTEQLRELYFSKLSEIQTESMVTAIKPQTSGWRLTTVNEAFTVCPTYPKYFLVPGAMSESEVKQCANFRTKKRLPVLSYFDNETGCSITRSSQPFFGFTVAFGIGTQKTKGLKYDKKMVKSILKANNRPNANPVLKILDLRPKLNAEANRLAKGGGYEKSYKDTDLHFSNIANIHVVRTSFFKLCDICTKPNDAQFYSKIEQSGWFEHLRTILKAAKLVVDCIDSKSQSVLLHCSDGWDRTSQVSSLAQMLLDSYFRTLEGFSVLIEKEWLSFGHQFQKRIGVGQKNFAAEERGPVFVQFLDCVYQIMHQFPTSFQFNEVFLIEVIDGLYSGRFGTFLFDCEYERYASSVRSKAPSIWSYVLSQKKRNELVNPFYDEGNAESFNLQATSNAVLSPQTQFCYLRLWDAYWLRYASSWGAKERSLKSIPPHLAIQKSSLNFLQDRGKISAYEQNNERTVETFQSELKRIYQEMEGIKKQSVQISESYLQLLEIVEKQPTTENSQNLPENLQKFKDVKEMILKSASDQNIVDKSNKQGNKSAVQNLKMNSSISDNNSDALSESNSEVLSSTPADGLNENLLGSDQEVSNLRQTIHTLEEELEQKQLIIEKYEADVFAMKRKSIRIKDLHDEINNDVKLKLANQNVEGIKIEVASGDQELVDDDDLDDDIDDEIDSDDGEDGNQNGPNFPIGQLPKDLEDSCD